jgi:hypothetical protein
VLPALVKDKGSEPGRTVAGTIPIHEGPRPELLWGGQWGGLRDKAKMVKFGKFDGKIRGDSGMFEKEESRYMLFARDIVE